MNNKKQSNKLTIVLLVGLVFLVVEYAVEFGSRWDTVDHKLLVGHFVFLVPSVAVLLWLQMFINQNFAHAVKIIDEFLTPLLIAVFVVFIGTFGFLAVDFSLGDAIFAAGNLLTLNASVLASTLGSKAPNLLILAARIFGGIFLAYAFFFALVLAVGKENYNRIRFRWHRVVLKKPFTVVIGNSLKAVLLAKNLDSNGRVVLLYEGLGETLEAMLEDTGIWYMQGNSSSKAGLDKTFFYMAEKVFVLHESDVKNFRTIQEMDEILKIEHASILTDCYVHLSEPRKKMLIHNYAKAWAGRQRRISIHSFDFEQNIARKITFEHKIDGFDKGAHIAQVVLLGFNPLAESIAIQCLNIGHFKSPRYLHIKVYYTAGELERVNRFKEAHPELFRQDSVFDDVAHPQEAELFRIVRKYTFFGQSDSLIEFEPLPEAESKLISPDFSFYRYIGPQYCTSIYACLSSGLESAALLNAVLPCLAQKMADKAEKTGDVQVFCQYNFPDEAEKTVIEGKLREITNEEIPVYCFGNYFSICTADDIENRERDKLAKYIAFLYSIIPYNDKDINKEIEDTIALLESRKHMTGDIDSVWVVMSEVHKESNRQAADQAWVKFREAGRKAGDLPADLRNYWAEDLPMLGEIEHRRWNAEKLLLGWLPTLKDTEGDSGGKKKLDAQKRHFYLTTFKKLPPKQQLKDYTQVIGLPYFIRDAGIEIPPCDRENKPGSESAG